MKIAILSNLGKELSLSATGGTELFIYELVSELAKRPLIDKIAIYGIGKNHFTNKKIEFISLLNKSPDEYIEQESLLKTINSQTTGFIKELQDNLALSIYPLLLNGNYDLIHNNSNSSIINSLLQHISTPTITTLHTNIDSPSIIIPYKLNILQKDTNNFFATIANHQAVYASKYNISLNIISNIYNGINISNYSTQEETTNKGYGLWIGRIYRKHNKGLKEAIIASKKSEKNLVAITTTSDEKFFKEEIKPLLTSNITFLNEAISLVEKKEYYQNASFFLYPILWEEPFGLVFLESMACGTPVIAYARGSVPEIIKDGVTGFIVNSSDQDVRGDWIIKKTGLDGLCEAIERIYSMPESEYRQMRINCRRHVEQNFTVERMVDEYEKVYQKIIGTSSQ